MNSKVQNTKQTVLPGENSFNDEDILQDVMTSLKHLSTQYGLLMQEASNEKLAQHVETLSKDVGKMARDSFNLMFEMGWYCLEKQELQKLNEEYNKFLEKEKQLIN